MTVEQFDIWIADLNPRIGTEADKTRPVLIIQTELLNRIPHPSTIICPITTNVKPTAEILRVHLKRGEGGMEKNSDIMLDQIRAIDNARLTQKVGKLPIELIEKVKENLAIVLDLG